eukprot:426312_1
MIMAVQRSKRKLNEIKSNESEQTTKKGKHLCSGLLSMDHCVINNLIKHWTLLNIDYDGLNLNKLKIIRNIYYFCDGQQKATDIAVPQCVECTNAMKSFQAVYELYMDPFILCICKFLNESYGKIQRNTWSACHVSTISNTKPFQFMLQVHSNHLKHRNIVYNITKDNIEQITDIKHAKPKLYPFSNNECTLQKLIKFFSKKVGITNKCCEGIKNAFEYFTESNYGVPFNSARWIYNEQYIVHKDCVIFSKQKVCSKCISLRHSIQKRMKKNAKQNGNPSKFTANQHLSHSQLITRNKNLKMHQIKVNHEAKKKFLLLNRYNKLYGISVMESDAKKNDEYGLMVQFLLSKYDDIKTGLQVDNNWKDDKICILFDQFKYAARRYQDWSQNDNRARAVNGIRWSAAMLNMGFTMMGKLKNVRDSKSMFIPSTSSIQKIVLKFRHTDMSSMDILTEFQNALILFFGTWENVMKDILDLCFDEIIVSDDTELNPNTFEMAGRPYFHQSNDHLQGLKHALFRKNNNENMPMNGSKYIMQYIIRSRTSGFVWNGPHFGSDSGLSALEILCYGEYELMLPVKLNLDIEFGAFHCDCNSHHQQYILKKSGKKTLKQLLGDVIMLKFDFYDKKEMPLIPDKDHGIKGNRNYICNAPKTEYVWWNPLVVAFEWDCVQDTSVLELSRDCLFLNAWNKMDMKWIHHLFSMKNILAFKDIAARIFIPKLSETIEFIELTHDFYIGKYMNIKVGHKYCQIRNLESDWFVETKDSFNKLIDFIEKHCTSMANITKLSVHGLYYGMNYLAHEVLENTDHYFCAFKSGEAIVEYLFSKVRGQGKATTTHYATVIGSDNYKKKNQKKKQKKKNIILII